MAKESITKGQLTAKLERLKGTREAIRDAIQSKGISVPETATFRDYANLIGSISGGNTDVSDVVYQTWFNPGTMLGGISWTDPGIEFEYIEIADVSGGGEKVVAQIDPEVQFFEPEEGTHQYRIRAKLANGTYTVGYTLPELTFEIIFRANLQSITIPMAAANQITLSFDNFVKLTDASGFTITGVDDSLVLMDQPDSKTIRLRLATKYFTRDTTYMLNYDPAVGNVLQNNDEPIDPIVGHIIENYADYAPAQFVSAQIPQGLYTTLVLLMSRPIHVADVNSFSLTGTTASIVSVVSHGITTEFMLSEPVDSSEVEPNIKLSYDGTGAYDDAGQLVAAFENRTVENNSTHQAISIHNAEIPASSSRMLILVMQGAVRMTTAAGFSLSSPDQTELPDLSQAQFSVSDGTIIFNFDTSLLAGRTFIVSYNGLGTLQAISNNDTIPAFSKTVVNNSTDAGGIAPGGTPRNLAYTVLGRESQIPADITQIMETVHRTIANGHVANLNYDFFYLPISASNPFVVERLDASGGGRINLTTNADLGAHGRHIGFRIVSKNGHKGRNGVDYDHVVFHAMNVFGAATDSSAEGHWMEATDINTNGYLGSRGRQYVLQRLLPALQAFGIPFDQDWIKPVPRRVSRGGSAANPGFDTITDKLWYPTEFEMRGEHVFSNPQAEAAANQGRYEYYDSNTKRIKYDRANTARWYLQASPYSGHSHIFTVVSSTGSATDANSLGVNGGSAPAFCVA